MIRRTTKYPIIASLMSFAAPLPNAGTAAVTPALAACSKALVETMAKSETLPRLHRQGAEPVRLGPR